MNRSKRLLLLGVGYAAVFCSIGIFGVTSAHAAEALGVTVVPSFFQVNLKPGDSWSSVVRVINPNRYTLFVSPSLTRVHVEKDGSVSPILENNNLDLSFSLVGWVSVAPHPTTILPGKTADIPFQITVPRDAPPGGHYAFLKLSFSTGGSGSAPEAVGTQSTITSLLLVRIEGSVYEWGVVDGFRSARKIYYDNDIRFALTFKNSGNVHLSPKGSITISDVFGKVRGVIPLSKEDFGGHIFANSYKAVEKIYAFEDRMLHFGMYRARLDLEFAEGQDKKITKTLLFWIIPPRETVGAFAILFLFLFAVLTVASVYSRYLFKKMMLGEFRHKDEKEAIKDTVIDLRDK